MFRRTSGLYRRISCCLLAAVLLSCRSTTEDSGLDLVGGKTGGAKLFPSTLFLKSGCTATKIAADALVTAAHCVMSAPFKDIKPQFMASEKIPLRMAQGNEVSRDESESDVSAEVAGSVVYPTYWKACQDHCDEGSSVASVKPNPHDVALIFVKLPNSDFEKIPVMTIGSRATTASGSLYITGFGCEEGANLPDASVVRFKYENVVPLSTAKIDSTGLIPEDLKSTLKLNFVMTPGINWRDGGKAAKASLCPGDSGGPLVLMDAKNGSTLVGINSFMIPPEKDELGISAVNFHTRVDKESSRDVWDWITHLSAATVQASDQQSNPVRFQEPPPETECRYCRFTLELAGPLVGSKENGMTGAVSVWDMVFLVNRALKKGQIKSWVYHNSVEISRSTVWMNVKILPGGAATAELERHKNWKVQTATLTETLRKSGIKLKAAASYVEILPWFQKASEQPL